nr:DUF933 domain-containing protein [Nocardiopsis xinjiangensis]
MPTTRPSANAHSGCWPRTGSERAAHGLNAVATVLAALRPVADHRGTDCRRGFIEAEAASFAGLVPAGDMRTARSAGEVRIGGKEYVRSDGNVVEFRFDV